MKSYQFFTADGRGGTMLCDDETLEDAVAELRLRFTDVVKVQLGKQLWQADTTNTAATSPPITDLEQTDQAILDRQA